MWQRDAYRNVPAISACYSSYRYPLGAKILLYWAIKGRQMNGNIGLVTQKIHSYFNGI